MSWSRVQQIRLQIESQTLHQYFPNFKWINPTDPDNTKVEGYLKANTQMFYKIRVYVPPDFPNSMPDLVIMDNLKGYKGRDLKVLSARMHTLTPRDGHINICHTKPINWVPSKTLYFVVIKGRTWIEAYESHLQTGMPIDYLLEHTK
jgi:hypothetical protein